MVGAIVHAAEMLWALGLWLSVLIKVMGFVGEVADGIVLVVKLTVAAIGMNKLAFGVVVKVLLILVLRLSVELGDKATLIVPVLLVHEKVAGLVGPAALANGVVIPTQATLAVGDGIRAGFSTSTIGTFSVASNNGKESTVTRSSPKSAIAIILTVSASTSKAAK